MKTIQMVEAKFKVGKIVATRAAMAKMDPDYACGALQQHVQARWGICDPEDWKANDEALAHGGRLLSVYPLPEGSESFWIITEHDRSVTTILLPSDY